MVSIATANSGSWTSSGTAGGWTPVSTTDSTVMASWEEGPSRKYRRKTLWQKGMVEANKGARDIENISSYRSQNGDELVRIFGKINPVHARVPKKIPGLLLEGVVRGVKRETPLCHQMKRAGMLFRVPHVIGRSKISYRTTLAGLVLLDHWAKKFPGFVKFYEAYRSPKQVKLIKASCFDFEMGAIPEIVSKNSEEHERRVQMVKAKPIPTTNVVTLGYGDIQNLYTGTDVVSGGIIFHPVGNGTVSVSKSTPFGMVSVHNFHVSQLPVMCHGDTTTFTFHDGVKLA